MADAEGFNPWGIYMEACVLAADDTLSVEATPRDQSVEAVISMVASFIRYVDARNDDGGFSPRVIAMRTFLTNSGISGFQADELLGYLHDYAEKGCGWSIPYEVGRYPAAIALPVGGASVRSSTPLFFLEK